MTSVRMKQSLFIIVVGVACVLGGRKSKIVGGHTSDITTRPYQVSLIIYYGSETELCGGSILTPSKILTAAHCFLRNTKRITIRAGSNSWSSGGVTRNTTKYSIHPLYNQEFSGFDYDVAIIDLENPLPLNNHTIAAVKLSEAGFVTPDGTPVTVSGWGDTSENGTFSDVLLEVTLNKDSKETCKKIYPSMTPRMICASLPEGEKDSCQGDSGGPLVLENHVQIGIVSYGQGCARKGVPGVYSKVASLRKWIKKKSGV